MTALLIGLVVGTAVFFTATALVPRRRWVQRRVAPHVVTERDARERRDRGTGARAQLEALLEATEERLHGRAWDAFARRVERADLKLQPVALLYVLGVAAVLLALIGTSSIGAPAVVLAPAVVFGAAWIVLGARAQRRLRAFDEQLPDILSALSGSLRAGHGFLQSLQSVAMDADDPAQKELRRVLAETRLGRPLEDALRDLGRRIPSSDLLFVLTAINVQRQVGGSLASLFETVNETVRQRQQFGRKVRSLTATARTSAQVLAGLPLGLLLLLTTINRQYMLPLYTSSIGRALLIGSGCSILFGSLVLRRIAALKGVVK